MDHDERRRRFEEHIASTGEPLASLTPRIGLELILRFCAEAKHILLYSWGNVAIYGTEEELGFSYNFTEHVNDLVSCSWELKFNFSPRERAGDQQGGDLLWGCFPEDLETFLAKVE